MSKGLEKVGYTSPEGSSAWEYVSALSCSSLIFGVGLSFGWVSPGVVILMGPDSPISCTESDVSMIVTLIALGYGLSPLLMVFMADKLGRKNSLIAITVPMMINWGLSAVATDVTVLGVAKFIGGLSSGLSLCLTPMYMGEIASPKLRGALGMGIGIMTNAGFLCSYLAIPYMPFRTSNWVYLAYTILSMVSLWFIPDSPYFLAMIGRLEAAEIALEKLRGKTEVAEELELIKRTVSYEDKQGEESERVAKTKKQGVFKQLVSVRGNRRAFYILFLFMFVLQFGSFGALVVYSQVLFGAMKSGIPSNLCSTILAAIQLLFTVVATFVVDRFGRRPLILASGLVSGGCLLVVGVYFFLMEYTAVDVAPYRFFPVVALFLNIAALSLGLVPLSSVLQGELIATEVKSLVISMTGVVNGVFATAVASLYLRVSTTWGFGHSVPFLSFFFVTWTTTGFILKMLPETKGKTFLDIQKDLNA